MDGPDVPLDALQRLLQQDTSAPDPLEALLIEVLKRMFAEDEPADGGEVIGHGDDSVVQRASEGAYLLSASCQLLLAPTVRHGTQ